MFALLVCNLELVLGCAEIVQHGCVPICVVGGGRRILMGNTFCRQFSCLGINEDQCTAVLIYSKFLQGVSCKLYIFAPQKVNSDSRSKQNTSLNLGRKEFKKKSPVPPTLVWRTDFLHMRYFAFYSLIIFSFQGN
uniref:Secreted protein n=1 Tax=Micrurus surinamensis TaxID=129470 RepID=A0A2D4PIR8_MICSU